MAYRKKIKPKASKRLFSKTAKKSNRRNETRGRPMRGGFRL